jgi:exonuclease III
MPNLSGPDVDNNLSYQVDFNYYSIPNFQNNDSIGQLFSKNSSFSVLHSNVRSLSANHDKLTTLLCDLKHNFHIVGISETKILTSKDCMYSSQYCIPEYIFISQPSHQNAGGVGMYIRDDCEFHSRDDLSLSTVDFESLWIEIHSKFHRNMVCSVIYRHPHSNLENFTNHLTQAMHKISKEGKYCILMGDFNINLLNYESHTPTDEFINNLGVFCFQPHILQPTRITDHSATLIDNIFFNSIEHYSISGNLLCDISDHLPNFSHN